MNFIKKGLDLLLILILLAASVAVIIFGTRNGGGIQPVPTSTSTASPTIFLSATITSTPTETLTPTATLTSTLPPASAAAPTQTVTFTALATLTPSPTLTSTPTLTANATSTGGPLSPLSQEVQTGIVRGNGIVKAIEAYHAAMGVYPPGLQDLVPAYLDAIPLTSTGQPYIYRLFESTSPMASEVYWLEFRAVDQAHVVCTYMRRIDYWDCNYNSP